MLPRGVAPFLLYLLPVCAFISHCRRPISYARAFILLLETNGNFYFCEFYFKFEEISTPESYIYTKRIYFLPENATTTIHIYTDRLSEC